MMKSIATFLLILAGFLVLLPSSPVFAQDAAPVQESVEDRQVREVSKQLRCAVCQNESVADSGSALARSMRDLVREQLREGKTPEEVKAYFVSKYGDYILMEPRKEGVNIFLWGIPVLLLVLGAAGILMRQRGASKPGAAETAATPKAGADDETLVNSQQLIARLRDSSRDETEPK